MKHRFAPAAATLVLAALWGCGAPPDAPPAAGAPAVPDASGRPAAAAPGPDDASAAGYRVAAVEAAGRVSGRVLFRGTPPAPAPIAITKDAAVCGRETHVPEDLVVGPGGGVRNAVVFLDGIAAGKPFPADLEPVLDQRGCWFHPHVQVLPAGATLEILNNDGILHNVRTSPGNNPPINMAQPKFRRVLTTSFARPDIVKVSCDVHVWMTAWLFVAGHPYHAVSGPDGGFSLDGVPPGSYVLRAWHETLGTDRQPVTVPPAGAVEATFTFGG